MVNGLENNNRVEYKKPNWMILKEAAKQLFEEGRKTFTRKELTRYAQRLDPTRPITSLDFEIDLVTVNSNSKDKYRSPEKLFLFRISRGRYTLYDPEVHGPLEKYLEYRLEFPTRRQILENIMEQLKREGYEVREVKHLHKPLLPDLVALKNGLRIGIWIIDPGADKGTQLKILAYAIGSALLNNYDEAVITVPREVMNRIPYRIREVLSKHNIRLTLLKEEKRYVITL